MKQDYCQVTPEIQFSDESGFSPAAGKKTAGQIEIETD